MRTRVQPDEILSSTEPPRLLVELPSRSRVFFGNLRDLLFPGHLPELELRSAPAAFWPDVFVYRSLPWRSFFESGAYHFLALASLIIVGRFMALRPAPLARTAFEHSQVVYYSASEYLPPLDTRTRATADAVKADPVYSPQPIIPLPAEADNRSQTIVTPPNIKLKQDVALPNMIAWSDKETKPQLAIPPVPLTPASEITRLAPRAETSVVTPPPDLQQSRSAPAFSAPQPAVVAPPPAFDPTVRTMGELNIGPSQVIAPAPQLPVAAQRALAGRTGIGINASPQVVPPPPSVSKSGSANGGESFGSAGRVVALSLHPQVGAPPAPPAGNRRGAFATGPEGQLNASATPGSSAGNVSGRGAGGDKGVGSASETHATNGVPAGLYVGKANEKTSVVAGDSSGKTEIASAASSSSVPAARGSNAPVKTATPDSAAKLSEAERSVFGERKFYSLTLNMPNLNSAGGSWVIRFAEIKQTEETGSVRLTEPFATRKVDPGYPEQLIRENVSGTVIIYGVIHADGTVGDVRVLRGVDDRLDRYASHAVSQWKFEPATKDGTPVDVEATFKIPFRPPRNNF